jgi:hypothetical protein
MTPTPRTTNPQDLREAFTSIISMILGLLRAHGLRGLLHLRTMWLFSRQLRRLAEEFCDLFAAFQAGTLPPSALASTPTPEPWPASQDRQPAPAQTAATPCRSARPATPRHNCSSQPAPAQPARDIVRERTRRAWRRSAPDRLPAPLGLVRATASQKRPVLATLSSHAQFVTSP